MSQPPPLQPTRLADGRTVVALPAQALSDDWLEATRTQLIALGDGVLDGELHLDCTRINSLNSSALGLLVALHRRLDDAGGSLVICHLAAHLQELCRLTRLDTLLHIRAGE